MSRRPRPQPSRRPGRPSRLRARAAAGLGLLAALVVAAPATAAGTTTTGDTAASAAESTGATPGAGPITPPAATTGRAPLVVVLDASGSMALEDAGGERFDRAREELGRALQGVPDDTPVSVLVYGTRTGPNASEQQQGCSDVVELVPQGTLDRDAVRAAVDEVIPSGYSPVGLALRQAAARLPAAGPASVLLVSDGFDLCATPDPCETAQQLAGENPQLTINVIGIQPDAAADTALQCLTRATRGSYLPLRYPDPTATPTTTPDEAERSSSEAAEETARTRLADALAAGYRRDAQPFTPDGDPVTGGATAETAPELLPGDHLDDGFTRGTSDSDGSRKNGTARYYRLPLGTAMTPWVSATVSGTRLTNGYQQLGLRVGLVDADDDACLPPVDESVSVGGDDPVPLVTARTGGVRPGGTGWSSACATDAPVFLRVERLGEYRFGTATPVTLSVRQEPPAAIPGGPAGTSAALPVPSPAAQVTTVAAGTGFATAPLLTSGSTVSDTVVSGESRFWAVTVGWGQRLRYRVEPLGEGTPVGAVRGATVDLRGPLRTELPLLAESQGQTFAAGSAGDDWPGLTGSTPVPVLPGNRGADDATVAAYSLPGTHYLVLSLAPARDDPPATVPYRITVTVEGAPQGGPSYSSAAAPTGSGSAPTSAAAATPPVTRRPVPGWLWAVAAGSLLLTGIGLVTILSRRRTGAASRR